MPHADLLKWSVRRLPAKAPGRLESLVVAAVSVAAAALVRALLQPLLHGGVPFITFFPAVAVAGVLGGWLGGVLAIALSGFVAAYGWVPPFADGRPVYPFVAALAVFAISGGLVVFITTLLGILLSEVRASEERAMLTAREMKHRVANMITMVNSIVRQTALKSATTGEFARVLQARLRALGCAQSILLETTDAPFDLKGLLLRITEPFGRDRIRLGGPPIRLAPETCTPLALLFHELATNATKYGALSRPGGRVDVSWAAAAGLVSLDWHETGGPPVAPPGRKGFGTAMVASAVPAGMGSVTVAYEPGGVRCTVELRASASADHPASSAGVKPSPAD